MLPENITKLIGKQFGKVFFDIEKESVKRFADSVGETNPLYYDAEYAAKTRYESVIAPPGFISAPWYWGDSGDPEDDLSKASGITGIIHTLISTGYNRIFDGGVDYEFMEPVRVGDTITATSLIKNVVERGKGEDKAVFLFIETTYTNQNNETVAVMRMNTIHR